MEHQLNLPSPVVFLYKVYTDLDSDPLNLILSPESAEGLIGSGFMVTLAPEQHLMSAVAIRNVETLTGHHVTLKPGEYVTNMSTSSDCVTITIQVFDLREYKTGFTIKKSGIRLYGWHKSESDTWPASPCVTLWDEKFEPHFVRHLGNGLTPGEWLARRTRDRMAYRVGSDRNPMDNFSRTHDQYSAESMKKHWR